MQLIGSERSPYVRRIRILLDELKISYKFIKIDIFSKEGQLELAKYTNTARVPVLEDNGELIWDSLLISKYIYKKVNLEFSFDEKDLVLINEANDSAVSLFQFKHFNLDSDWENPMSKMHFSRIKKICKYFEKKDLKWDLEGNWLFCFLDWIEFREVYFWKEKYPNLLKFYQAHSSLKEVVDSKPK